MDHMRIEGGVVLRGQVAVSGAKNAALPLLAASLLSQGSCRLLNVPDLVDIRTMIQLLHALGSDVSFENHTIVTQVRDESHNESSYDLVQRMRASICVLGPLLAKRGQARVSFPGGCVIGPRPIDLHLKGLRALGAQIDIREGYLEASCSKLVGAEMDLQGLFGSSVLATANTLMAATLALGTTVIHSAAREPEIIDLCHFLQGMGAKVSGVGTDVLEIEGVSSLQGYEYCVITDRIEAGTLLLAAVITEGDVTLTNVAPSHMMAFLDVVSSMGQDVAVDDQSIRVRGRRPIQPIDLKTKPYPQFPTDLQAQLMSTLCLAQGYSRIEEGIYPGRFMHVPELNRMGAQITLSGSQAVIQGLVRLKGAQVMSSDLRASAALVLAGLAAKGTSYVSRIYHLDRGYEQLEVKLRQLGACIERVSENVGV